MPKQESVSSRKELIEQVFLNLATLGRGICFKRETLFADDELGIAQTELIFQLFPEETLSMGQLAEKMFITKGALSQLVKPLEEKGILIRHQSEKDQRISLLTLTRNMKAKINSMHEEQYEHMNYIFNSLSDQDIAKLTKYLLNIKSNLYNDKKHSPHRCNR